MDAAARTIVVDFAGMFQETWSGSVDPIQDRNSIVLFT
jgi:hypothetical protein